jgi:YD repeat-containing protein
MKRNYPYFIYAVTLQLFLTVACSAQSVNPNQAVLKMPPGNITVDGNLKDWGDSLRYFDVETNIRYTFANDKDNLYFAVRINDRSEAIRILKAGITLSIDPKGKKKDAYSITFPINVQEGNLSSPIQQNGINEVTQADRDELLRETITTLRGIKIEGFKDIEGDMITTSNTYGIQTAINYDTNGNLVCEEAVPLKFFHLDGRSKAEWLFNVKINGIERPIQNKSSDSDAGGMGSGGRGGRGGGGHGSHGNRGGGGNKPDADFDNTASTLAKSEDFSGKFYLLGVQ